MKVEFFPDAADELLDAAAIYESDVRGLGHDFMLEVERVIAVLTKLPYLGEMLDDVHRRIPLRRFPYALIFRHDANVIRVVAVAHCRRRPRYWAPRVHDRGGIVDLMPV
ncbi:type II toxin-antitoxin system RelE/ParE family toxin [Peristeroidobacter soli]|jgi:plasmid stabilization system protein ParE|uniref:type II toxin-antitoxin system RelE/ParE family toxin n=1 Tax=Peristeroidobacter soli TaxID=2497877 RepID=UPI00101CFBA7|nr:type II toxin-antitoxin system RelE/ParE family toxin [Peristeroidobacter soli]